MPKLKTMSTLIPPTPAANKSAEQHQEPSEQDSFNHLLYKVLRLTSEQVQDLNGWMKHRGIPNVHEVIAQNFRKPHALEDNLKFITQGKTCYIQSNVMLSLSLMISYIRHRHYLTKSKYFGPFYYIQIDPQDYDEWHTTPPEEEIHFSGPKDEDAHQNLSSDDNQVIQQENVCSEPPESLSYSLFQSHFQGSSTSNTQKIFLPKPIWEKLSKDQQQMIIDHNRSLPKSGSPHLSTPNKSPSPLPHKPTPQQTAKSQQVHTHQSDESTTDTTKTETTPSDPLLEMVHQSIHTSDDDASDISNVLSVKRSPQIQVCQCYLFQHANHTNQQLVDCGANGGLAGSDMCVMHKTHRKINIQGIDNHEVTGLDVVTAATLLNTSQGKVIGIFNEYAYLGKGSSIHSSGQLEWFKTNVDEKSVKVGGTQLITTLDGYSVPLLIKDGLAYATSLGKPIDQDMDTYPHVFFTSPDEWDPSVLDHDPPHLGGLDPSQVPDQHQNKAENCFGLAKHYTNTVMNTLVVLLSVGYSVYSTSVLYSTTWHLQLFKAYALFKLWKELLQTLVSCFISHFMSLSTTGLILLNLISTFLHHLMKRRVIGSVSSTTKVTVSPGGSSLRKLKRSSFVLVFVVPSELQQTSILHHLQGRGPHFLFPFLILNNLQILCHLTPLMHPHPILSNLSQVSLVKMKIIQSPWPTLTFPIFLADPSFYHLRIMGSTTWPKSLTLMTMDNLLKTLNSS